MENKEIVKTEGNSPAEMIRDAVKGGADLDKLRGLLELQKDWEANEARKVYNDAMVAVHQNIPRVEKLLNNPQTHSKYASLDMIVVKTKEVYTVHGFSISFYEGETEKVEHIRVCADVIHRAGHKETYHYDVPLDGKGIKGNVNMTPIHAKASSMSYARRYLMCMIWNIPTGDDNDGQTSEVEYIDDKQLNVILDYVNEKDVNIDKFLEYMGIEAIAKMPKAKYNQAVKALEAKK